MKKTIVILLLGALSLALAGFVIFNTTAQEKVAAVLVAKGITLGQSNRSEEAIAVYSEVVTLYGNAPEVALREQVAMALRQKGVELSKLNRSEEAIAVYDEVVKRYGDAPEYVFRIQVALALLSKGARLVMLNRSEEAITVFDAVMKRYGDAPEAKLRENVILALGIKGNRLGVQNRYEEAFAAYGEVVKRYGSAPEAELREQVAWALNGWGFNLACKAKKVWQGGDEAAAAGLLKQALGKIEAALQRKSGEPRFLGHQGYILFLLGRVGEARPILAKAITLGGEELRQGVLKAADFHPLPQDKAFKTLIESL